MKRVLLTTRATATIEESWIVTVPDTWTEDSDPELLSEEMAAGMLTGALIFVGDRVIGDEDDRTVVAWRFEGGSA